MSVIAVARRYAEALADVATERKQVDQVRQELKQFVELYRTSPELSAFIPNSGISQSDKLKVVNAIIARTRPSEATSNLLRLLLKHYRLESISVVYQEFQKEINRRMGIVPAEITTAGPVSAGDQEIMVRRLQAVTGKQVQANFTVDPALIGGAITRIGSVVYDGSIRTQLETIKQRMVSASEGPDAKG
jgi:F-type H+-transporting ATPase subunit delta